MSLESKAKTTLELMKDPVTLTISGNSKGEAVSFETKWVPLEEAQKLEADFIAVSIEANEIRNQACIDIRKLGTKNNELITKIAEANKILDEHRTIGSPCHIMTKKLREVLK